MLDGFLPNPEPGMDRVKHIEVTQLHSYGHQASSQAKMVRLEICLVASSSADCSLSFSHSIRYEQQEKKHSYHL